MEIKLGKTDLKVKRIGFGGIPVQRLSFEESDRVIKKVIDTGINFIDTARVYTDSEAKIGNAISGRRDKVVLATKTYSRDLKGTEADIDQSLREFKTDRIDLFQCHNITKEEEIKKILSSDGAIRAIEKAKKEGKVRYIGVSGHKPKMLIRVLEEYPFDTVQFPFNIIETECMKELIPFAKKKGVGTIAMKPVAGGAITRVDLNLRYILTNGCDVAIPGMDSIEQVEKNFSILKDLSSLKNEELDILLKEKEVLGEEFCRRCEYCIPCPHGLPIPFLHLMRAYYLRYDLKDWVKERLATIDKGFADCRSCGICIEKCPYDLNMPKIFKEIDDIINKK